MLLPTCPRAVRRGGPQAPRARARPCTPHQGSGRPSPQGTQGAAGTTPPVVLPDGLIGGPLKSYRLVQSDQHTAPWYLSVRRGIRPGT